MELRWIIYQFFFLGVRLVGWLGGWDCVIAASSSRLKISENSWPRFIHPPTTFPEAP